VVNDDQAFVTGAGGPHNFMPSIAVNRDGMVGVAWCDRRDNTDSGWWMRFTASLDGGKTFLPSVRISEAPQAYRPNTPWLLTAASANNGTLDVGLSLHPFYFVGGDYSSMAADASGAFHPIWVDNRNGIAQVWTAAVRVKGDAMRHGEPNLVDLKDISAALQLQVVQTSYDTSKDIASMKVRLKNISASAVLAPVKARVLAIGSEIGRVRIADADNGMDGPGGVWDFTGLIEGKALAAGATSGSRILTFHLDHVQPLLNGATARMGIVKLEVQMLGRLAP
jgi:hypothetical protein